MATVEQHATPHAHNGAPPTPGADIPVENPATGQIAGTVPDLDAAAVAELAARARAAQPQWEAFGFEGRARILLRAQKWLIDNSERVIATIVSETGKTYEDAEFAEIAYAANAFGFWAKEAPNYLADERIKSAQVDAQGQEADPALSPARADRRDRPVELPAHELLRRLHPRARRRQQRDPQAVRGHAAHLAADGRRPARMWAARRRLPGRHRPWRHGRGADRAGRHDHVHRLHSHRTQGGRRGRRAPDPVFAWSSAARTR